MKRLFNSSMRVRLAVNIALFIFFIVLLGGVLLLLGLRNNLRQALYLKSLSQVRIVAISAGAVAKRMKITSLQIALQKVVQQDHEIVYAAIYSSAGENHFFVKSDQYSWTRRDIKRGQILIGRERTRERSYLGGVFSVSIKGDEFIEATHPILIPKEKSDLNIALGFSTKFLQSDIISSTNIFLGATALFLLAMIVVSFILGARFASPVTKLARAAELYSRENFSTNVNLNSHGELGVLETTFGQMRDTLEQQPDLVEAQVTKRTLKMQNILDELQQRDDEMQRELDFASKIQRGIIPQAIEPWGELQFRHFLRHKGKVGGDIFDVVQKDGNLLVYLADVSGHGVPAALITTMVKILFTDAIRRFSSPQDIVRYINKHIYRQLSPNKQKNISYFTAFTIMFNANMNFAYVSAAHPKALHYRFLDKSVRGLDQRGCPMIGVFPDDRFDLEYGMGSFRRGDRLVLYSDGLIDQRNVDGDYYSVERVSEVLGENGQEKDIDTIFSGLVGDFLKFMRGSLLGDDVTMLVISRDAEPVIHAGHDPSGEDRYSNA